MKVFFTYIGKHRNLVYAAILLLSFALFTGYTDIRSFVSGKADTLQLNSFVEPDFPFISTVIDARKLGPGFPGDNIAARTLALQLGDSAYACFDTDLLRWSVAWTGKFLPMVTMAQISYKDFFNKNNRIPTVTGNPKFATGSYSGWSSGKPVFHDERPAPVRPGDPKWGSLPAEKGRWKGVYVYGKTAVLNYSVGSTDILELPGSTTIEGQTIFTRSFQIGSSAESLYLTAAEVNLASASEIKRGIAYIYQGAGKDSVTAVGILDNADLNLQAGISDNRYLTIKAVPTSKTAQATIAIWKGPATKIAVFEKFCRKKHTALPAFKAGGPAHWSQAVTTTGTLSPDTAAYVTDKLNLPLSNPWKRNVRVADLAFFNDGRAAAVTFEGDVWMIEGIDKSLKQVKWKRFASGLHEPMSIDVVHDTVYIFGREGIVRLHDLNKDGEADFYENFSNVMIQSAESREWAGDMVYAPDGTFYIAKGGSQSNGPGVTAQVAKGFRAGSRHNGVVLKISQDGRKYEVIATGLRGPYLGIHPEKGILTASDQQGNFVPSTPVYLISKGDYYGVPPTAHRTDNPPVAPPLTWMPHSVDRSSISQAWITGNKMGPLSGDLIHFSFAHPGLLRVLIDSSSKIAQGGVSFINADYPAPTSKGVVNPADGQLYIAGFNLWGSSSTGISALLRLRYTGKPSYMPDQFIAAKQGIVLGFDSELDAAAAANAANFEVKRWNYKRTEEYGSGHYKTDGATGEETMHVVASYLSADRRKVLLLVPDMKEIMQMEVSYHLTARDGKKIADRFWFTVNNTSDLNPGVRGFNNVDLALLSREIKETVVQTDEKGIVSAEKGKELFGKMACSGCHSEGLKTKGMYGPPFQNLYKSERHFEDGSVAIADEKYIRESILTPAAKVVKGYNEEMPSFMGILTDADIESIALYIRDLSKKQ